MRNILYIIIATLALTACEEEIGEITFETKPIIIVNAMLEAESEEHVVQLRMTGLNETTPLPSAEITVYVNGEQVVTVTSDCEYYRFNAHFEANDKVDIEVTSKEMHQKASATCIVPEAASIEKTASSYIRTKNSFGNMDNYLRSLITIKRAKNKGTSYYRLTLNDDIYEVKVLSSTWDEEAEEYIYHAKFAHSQFHRYYYHRDIALNNGQADGNNDNEEYIDWFSTSENIYGIFTSAFFDGDKYTLNIDTDPYYGMEFLRHLNFKVRSITSEEYNYLAGLSTLKGYEAGYMLSNPAVVASNIKGGTGIFSISTATEAHIEEAKIEYLEREQFDDYIKNGTNEYEDDYEYE